MSYIYFGVATKSKNILHVTHVRQACHCIQKRLVGFVSLLQRRGLKGWYKFRLFMQSSGLFWRNWLDLEEQ